MFNKLKSNLLLISIVCIVSILIISLITYISKSTAFYADDMWFGTYRLKEGLFDSLFKNSAFQIHGGGYLCLFLTKFFNFGLPNILRLHPSDFMHYGTGFLKGLICISIFLLYAQVSTYFLKSKKLFAITFIFTSCYFLSTVFVLHSSILTINNLFLRYIVPILFFIIFWQFIYKNITDKNYKSNNFYLLFIIICGFINETGIEILMYASVLMPILIILYNLFFKFFKKNFAPSFSFNLNKEFYLPVIFSYIFMFLYNFSSGYTKLTEERDLNHCLENILYFKDFLKEYIDLYIIKPCPILILSVIVGISALYFAYKKEEVNKVIFPIIMQISIMLVYFSLILTGKSFNGSLSGFWLNHNQLLFLYYMVILYVFLMLLGYVLNAAKNNILNNSVFILFFISILYYLFCINPQIIKQDFNIDGTISKERLYICEKIMRFYYLRNEIPYLPVQFNKTDDMPDASSSAFIWLNKFEDYKQTPCKHNTEGIELVLTSSYYSKIYKDNRANTLGYCFSEDALEKFYKDGGVFTKKELEHIKFSKLFEKDFIYKNTKDEIITPEQILAKAKTQFL